MILPNRLTIARIVLTFAFVFFAFQRGVTLKIIAAAVFLLASLTDFFDGYYARKYNLISDFGKLMDPIADKFLILTAFFIFMVMHLVQGWMFTLILAREAGVTLVRLRAMRRGKVLAAERAGKIKTVLQTGAIFIILFFLILKEGARQFDWSEWFEIVSTPLCGGIYILMLVVVAVTLFSGASFLWNNRRAVYA